ncbi:MAG: MarR family transcriptional regulator [Clostridia bacterium]|nr:MarR family transcriptional regulator [Clostridia bacterium]
MEQELKKKIEILTRQVKEISAIYHHAAKKNGIPDSEFCILYSLVTMDEECTQKDICDLWSFPKQTVNSGISALTKKNYITLDNEQGVGNRKIIRLTKAGNEFGKRIVSKILESEKRAFSMMTKEEREECIKLVNKYAKYLKESIY